MPTEHIVTVANAGHVVESLVPARPSGGQAGIPHGLTKQWQTLLDIRPPGGVASRHPGKGSRPLEMRKAQFVRGQRKPVAFSSGDCHW